MTPSSPNEPAGSWDSIHVFETAERGRNAHYKLTSTVMLQLITRKSSEAEDDKKGGDKKGLEGWKRDGEVSLSGSMTRQVSLLVFLFAPVLKLFSLDRTGLGYTRSVFAYNKHR